MICSVGQQFKAMTVRRLFTTGVRQWLIEQKGLSTEVAEGIIKAFPGGRVSQSDINQLGDVGLRELIKSIERKTENDKHHAKRETITVHIAVPHERCSFSLKVPVGGNFQSVAQDDENVHQYLECVCGGHAACSTCHVIVDPADFARLPPPDEAELDMLDIAAEVTETSRLGCQIVFTPALEGLRVTIPREFNNVFGSSGGTSM